MSGETPLRAAFDRANHYVERLGEQRTPELLEEWSVIHADRIAGWQGA